MAARPVEATATIANTQITETEASKEEYSTNIKFKFCSRPFRKSSFIAFGFKCFVIKEELRHNQCEIRILLSHRSKIMDFISSTPFPILCQTLVLPIFNRMISAVTS